MSVFGVLRNMTIAAFVLLALVAVAANIKLPQGYRLLVVQSGSMEPTIGVGSLLLTKPAADFASPLPLARFRKGDVITFTVGKNTLVSHRIVEVIEKDDQFFYQTKGDANKTADQKLIADREVVGKMVFAAPALGRFVNFAKTRLGYLLLILIPSLYIIFAELLMIVGELRKSRVKVSSAGFTLPIALIFAAGLYFIGGTAAYFSDTAQSTENVFTAGQFAPSIANHLVINEVYYQVDASHGLDSSKDRGIKTGSNSASNSNTGAGSSNTANASSSSSCTIDQSNSSNINTNINVETSTGGNSSSGSSSGGGVSTATASASVSVTNSGNSNSATCGNSSQNDEWVEIFNPTGQDISLKGWTLTDNSGKTTKIAANKKIKAGGFALISKSASTWKFWNPNSAAVKVELGQQIGDGLDNAGDRLILKNPAGQVIDSLSYGSDISIFNPAIPPVPLGSSFERKTPGFDTDTAFDFVPRILPAPGN